MLNRGLDKQELLRIVDSVANEKSIDKELILSSMESAIQKAATSTSPSTTLRPTPTQGATGGVGNIGAGSGAGGMNKGGLMTKGKKKK